MSRILLRVQSSQSTLWKRNGSKDLFVCGPHKFKTITSKFILKWLRSTPSLWGLVYLLLWTSLSGLSLTPAHFGLPAAAPPVHNNCFLWLFITPGLWWVDFRLPDLWFFPCSSSPVNSLSNNRFFAPCDSASHSPLSWGLPSIADPSHQRTHYLGSDLRLSGLMDCLMDSNFSHRLSDSLLEQGSPGELRGSISASLSFAESCFALAALLSPPPWVPMVFISSCLGNALFLIILTLLNPCVTIFDDKKQTILLLKVSFQINVSH